MKTRYRKVVNKWFTFFLLMVLIIILRLLYFQTFGGDNYRALANKQRIYSADVPAQRGIIYDRNKNELAKSIAVYNLYSKELIEDEETLDRLSSALAPILSEDKEKLRIRLKTEYLIKEKISPDQAEEIEKLNLNEFKITVETERYYPYGQLASSLLGFVNRENNGVGGIEEAFNQELKGIYGKSIATTNLRGERIPFEKQIKHSPQDGKNIVLTIDENIQAFVEEAGNNAMKKLKPQKISIIVSNPDNGDILAMQDFPQYNLNKPYDLTDEEVNTYNKLSNEERTDFYYSKWKNHSISSLYEPGSVFKMITAAAAVEENTANDDSRYYCNGFIRDIPGVVIRCVSWMNPHGEETLDEALTNSCNPAFVQIARELGKDNFIKYINAFGFTDKTGVDLNGEARGMVVNKAEKMGDTSQATLSYGYGVATTPLQMMYAANTVVNGGYLMKPKIVLEENSEKEIKKQVISEKTSKKMQGLLKNVVDNAANNVSIAGYNIGGKSGTTLKYDNDGYNSEKVIASFYGFFPTDNPQYSVMVVIDEPANGMNGTSAAGPVVQEIIQKIIKYKSIEPEYDPQDKKKVEDILVPDLIGLTLKDATNQLMKLGLKTSIHTVTTDENIVIIQQNPAAGTKVKMNDTIFLEADPTKSAMIKMPNLTNMNFEQMKEELGKYKLEYEVKNGTKGYIIKTVPEDGVMIEPNTVIQIEFFDKEEEKKNKENLEKESESPSNDNNPSENSENDN